MKRAKIHYRQLKLTDGSKMYVVDWWEDILHKDELEIICPEYLKNNVYFYEDCDDHFNYSIVIKTRIETMYFVNKFDEYNPVKRSYSLKEIVIHEGDVFTYEEWKELINLMQKAGEAFTNCRKRLIREENHKTLRI